MKEVVISVQVWALSDPELDEADVIFTRDFKIGNFKVPLPDILDSLCSDVVDREYPDHKYVGYQMM